MADGRIYIGRLSYDVRERDLERFVKKYGRIREIMMKNGYAFVVSITNVNLIKIFVNIHQCSIK